MKNLLFLFLFFVCGSVSGQTLDEIALTQDFNGSHGIADIDGDGDLDILANGDAHYGNRPLLWYENVDGLGTYGEYHLIETLIDSPTNSNYPSRISLVGDLTGDGWPDFMTRDGLSYIHNGNGQDVSFSVVVNNFTSWKSLQLGDLDGDGDLDLLRFVQDNNDVFNIAFNSLQDGTFNNEGVVSLGFSFDLELMEDVELYDFDLDGDLDIVAAFSTYEKSIAVVWYENTSGQGQFSFGQVIDIFDAYVPGLSFIPIRLEPGDFDGNGLVDVLVAHPGALRLSYQTSENVWEPTIMQPTTQSRFACNIVSADFDNDGDIDFLETNEVYSSPIEQNSLFFYENINNSGAFEIETSVDLIDTKYPRKISKGDFDNDGDLDVVYSSSPSVISTTGVFTGVFLLKNDLDLDIPFGNPIQVSDNLHGFINLFCTDLDNDQDQDFVFYTEPNQQLFYISNIDSSTLFTGVERLPFQEHFVSIEMEDLDNDGDEDIIGINTDAELIWFENNSDSIVLFGAKQILQTNIDPKSFDIGDHDNDGDLDIVVQHNDDKAFYLYEQEATISFVSHFLGEGTANMEIMGQGDIDNDGLNEFFYKSEIGNVYDLHYLKNTGGVYSTVYLFTADEVSSLILADFENDSDNDLLVSFKESNNYYLRIYRNTNSGLVGSIIHETDDSNEKVSEMLVADLDGDEKKDVYTNAGWFKQLDEITNFSVLLEFSSYQSKYIALGDLDNDGDPDFITSGSLCDPVYWNENQFNERYWIEGRVAIDENLNCEMDLPTDTMGLYGRIVEFENNGTIFYASTNANGNYVAPLPPTDTSYIVNVTIPNNYWYSCVVDTLLTGLNADSTIFLDFPIQIVEECPLMKVDINSSNLRPCLGGSISIQFCNEGTVLAVDAQVEVVLDQYLNLNSANYPYTETDSSYLFDVGDVDFLDCGTLQLSVTPDCDFTQVGDEVCVSAYVTPDTICAPLDSLWDGSEIEVNSVCINDSLYFEVKNVGIGAMSEIRQLRAFIVNDDIILMIMVDTFILESDEAKYVLFDPGMDILQLEADQDENHPYLTIASATGQCSNGNGATNILPQVNSEYFSDYYCRTLTGSYDPNAKGAFPLGYSPENLIDRQWELDYTIHFQNTGNDTAFTVVIKDEISEFLDLSTLRIGAASHAFIWELNTQRELAFTFDNILLPDSTTNEAASHGHVQFFITPDEETPFGTVIGNEAAIYFDFNPAIITNQVVRTIQTPIFATSEHIDLCEGTTFLNIEITNDTILIDSMLSTVGWFIDYYHLHVQGNEIFEVDTALLAGGYIAGVEITQDTTIEVLYTSSIGCDSLVSYNIATLVSTNELLSEYNLEVYPIPAKETIYILWTNNAAPPSSVSVIDMNGSVLNSYPINGMSKLSNPFRIEVGNLPKGVYWLEVTVGSERMFRRFVKM